jgi:hypothetical protein
MRHGIFLSVLAAFSLSSSFAAAQEQKSFRLDIGAASVELDPGETVEVTLPDGSKANVKLTRNAFTTYEAGAFSFVHPSDVSVTKSDLGDGVIQHLMASAIGTIAIVQQYDKVNPALLTEFMLGELTREAIAAGAKVEKAPHSRDAGKKLEGLKATESGSADRVEYEVLAYGSGTRGVLIVTSIDEENREADGQMLEKFWETLRIN